MPQYYWDSSKQRYETRAGRAVSPKQVRAWVDQTVAGSRERVRKLSEQFTAGRIDLPTWFTRVQQEIRGGHMAMAEIASGGRAQFTPTQAGRVGARLRSQYGYLMRFSLDVETGSVSKAQLVARAELYAEALRGTYEGARRGNMMDAGFQMERSLLGGGNNCDECIEQDGLGWQPIGAMVPIGSRTCLANCNCETEYQVGEASF